MCLAGSSPEATLTDHTEQQIHPRLVKTAAPLQKKGSQKDSAEISNTIDHDGQFWGLGPAVAEMHSSLAFKERPSVQTTLGAMNIPDSNRNQTWDILG